MHKGQLEVGEGGGEGGDGVGMCTPSCFILRKAQI